MKSYDADEKQYQTQILIMENSRLFALQAAQLQDSLLQNYRKLMHMIALALLGFGAIIVLPLALLAGTVLQIIFTVVLFIAAAASLLIYQWGTKLINMRAKDVDYWHRQIMVLEESLPPAERTFTLFKISQKHGKVAALEVLENEYSPLTNANLDELMSKLKTHSRSIWDNSVPMFYGMMWAGLVSVSGVSYLFV